MAYSVGQHTIAMDPKLIADVVVVLRAPSEPDEGVENRMWSSLDRLSRLANPVTAQSLRSIDELERDARDRPGFMRNHRKDAPARKIVWWARRWAYLALAVVVSLQIYALVGSRLVEEIDQLDNEARKLGDQLGQLQKASGAQELTDALDRRLDEIERMRWPTYEMLATWLMFSRADAESLHKAHESGAAADAWNQAPPVELALQARMLLQALSLHILPVLYGFLGASAFILRQITSEFASSTFAATSIFRYRIRQGLGIVLGLGVGVLPWTIGPVEPDISVSKVALAFLAGYNVDAVFAILDGWLKRVRDQSAAQKTAPPARQEQSAAVGEPPADALAATPTPQVA